METDSNAFSEAFKTWERLVSQHNAFRRSEGKDAAIASAIAQSVPRGLYEHWKSSEGDLKFYVVFGAGVQQDVHAALVSYAALYRPHHGVLTFRDLVHEQHGFLAPISRDVYRGPRFRLVTELMLGEISTLLAYVGELIVIRDPTEFRLHVGKLVKKNIPLF